MQLIHKYSKHWQSEWDAKSTILSIYYDGVLYHQYGNVRDVEQANYLLEEYLRNDT